MMLPTSLLRAAAGPLFAAAAMLSFLHLQLFGCTLAMWFKCKLVVCARDVRAVFFALSSYDICGQTSTHSQAFSPSLVPTVWPLTRCVPAQFELMHDEAMQREVSSKTIVSKQGHSLSLSLSSSFPHSILLALSLRQLGAILVWLHKVTRWVLMWPDCQFDTRVSCFSVRPKCQLSL